MDVTAFEFFAGYISVVSTSCATRYYHVYANVRSVLTKLGREHAAQPKTLYILNAMQYQKNACSATISGTPREYSTWYYRDLPDICSIAMIFYVY